MVCRTWWWFLPTLGVWVGEEWVSVLDLYSFENVLCFMSRDGWNDDDDVEEEMIHLIIIFKTSRTKR